MAVDHRGEMNRDIDLTSLSDSLTGLPSARIWGEGIRWGVDHAEESDTPLTIALLDVDGFDLIADAAPQAADRLLKGLASCWHAALEETGGMVARLFGGRFGLLLPGCGLAEALDLVEDFRDFMPNGITLSVAVAGWADESPEALAARVDAGLVRATLHRSDRAVVAV